MPVHDEKTFEQLFPSGPVIGSIRPPGSKSLTNRALVCAALATGTSHLTGVLDSEDTQVMVEAWRSVGLKIDWDKTSSRLEIQGCSGVVPMARGDLFIANSGTSIRFLTAALSACGGDFRLDGVPRMRQRPVADLMHGLQQLGAKVSSENLENPGCPPVRIQSHGLQGGKCTVAGNVSSQFLSGLLMAAPYARSNVELQVVGELVSRPYVEMTSTVMKAFGVFVEQTDHVAFLVKAPQTYTATHYDIEPDASAASYFFASAAIAGGTVRVQGLGKHAIQGDVGFCEVLAKMGASVRYGSDFIEVQGGALNGIDIDMNEISDTVQTLAAVALFADGPTRVRGVAHNRFKETDRIGDLATELRKLGAKVDEHDDGLTIVPQRLVGADIETYNDHRMAMSLALVGLKIPDVRILNPRCTHKTYPNFFDDMRSLTKSST